jgi:GTP cyclohydrolase I
MEKYPDEPIETKELQEQRSKQCSESIKASYEDNPELREIRRRDATEQMKDPEQIRIRQEKCGYEHTEEMREERSRQMERSGKYNYRKKAFQAYDNVCAHCGKTEEQEKKDTGSSLVVHHKNSNCYDNRVENLAILCRSCHSTLHNEQKRHSDYFLGQGKISTATSDILDALGVDLSDENFRNTPNRVARAFREKCQRCFEDDEEFINNLLSRTFPSSHSHLIVIGSIKAYSLCPHHLKDVEYDVDFGYIPEDDVLGLSKIPRYVKYIAKKPLLQEDYTEELANRFYKVVKPKALIVMIRGIHSCMATRGVLSSAYEYCSASRLCPPKKQ